MKNVDMQITLFVDPQYDSVTALAKAQLLNYMTEVDFGLFLSQSLFMIATSLLNCSVHNLLFIITTS